MKEVQNCLKKSFQSEKLKYPIVLKAIIIAIKVRFQLAELFKVGQGTLLVEQMDDRPKSSRVGARNEK